ncbi:MAG TPA: hypothetical protein VFA40_00990 [Terriglobales bacterium]|nr:hypothetical protein [Terriglobales bacterium]
MNVNEITIASANNPRELLATLTAKFDPALLLILALPWVVLYFDTTWLFAYPTSSFGFIDPWMYFGFFFDLTQHIRTFKGAYFTTRLTWTVPGAVVYHLFSPIVATYVLHLLVFYASILPLYLTLKVTVSRPAALLTTTMTAFHSYFLWSVGWPYIDGAGNMYVLLTLACLAFAARSDYPKWWLVAAGAVAAKTVYCQFFLISFAPLIFGFYYFARPQMGHLRANGEWKPFAWGFACVTVLYGLFNMAINGRFLFFINSVGMAAKIVIHRNPYNDSTYGWITGATWLIVPALATVGAIVCVSRRRSLLSIPNAEFLLFWQRYLILNVVIMIFWQLIGQPVLQLPTYASYLMPAVFLALGSQIAIVTNRLSKLGIAIVYAAVFLAGVLPFVPRMDLRQLTAHPMLLPFTIGAIALVTIGRQIRYLGAIAIVVLGLGLGILNAATSTRTWNHGSLPHDDASQKSALLAIVDSIHTVQSLDPKGNLFFWYDGESRLGRLYRDVASTYLWAYRLQSEAFPDPGPKAPPTDRRILILTEDPSSALKAANHSLAKLGLTANFLAQRKIQEGPFAWDMIEIQIARSSQNN